MGEILSRVYFICLFLWFAIYLFFGDRLPYFVLLNAAAIVLFLPLPLIAAANLKLRSRQLWLFSFVGLAIFAFLWGQLFLPKGSANTSLDSLDVLTYNVRGLNGDNTLALMTIEEADADLVLLQEFTPSMEAVVEAHLLDDYPYYWLEARDGANGMAILSKIEFTRVKVEFPGQWNGHPQMIALEWMGAEMHVINVHLHAMRPALPLDFVRAQQSNAESLQRLLDVVRSGAFANLIVAGDFNFTPQNDGYKQITSTLADAWKAGGWGFGNTFPVAEQAGLFVWRNGFPFLQRLIRIDYVFFSPGLQLTNVTLMPNRGGSDHLGLMASFSQP